MPNLDNFGGPAAWDVYCSEQGAYLADIKARLRELPVGSTDPGALLEAVGYEVGRRLDEAEFTIAELPLPFGGSIPLTIRLRDVASAREGGG